MKCNCDANLFCTLNSDCSRCQRLAVISVPMQQWRNIYSAETALQRGTLFEELDLPFYGGEAV